MKKAVSVLVAVFLLISLAACGQSSRAMSFNDFLEKYKRADYSAFVADPEPFLLDFFASSSSVTVDADAKRAELVATGWTLDETNQYTGSVTYVYRLEGILFNQPADYTGFLSVPEDHPENAHFDWYLQFLSDDVSMLFALSETLFNAYVNLCGDPTRVTLRFDDSTEHDLREAFRSGTPVFYDVSFDHASGPHAIFFSRYGRLSIS